MIEIKILGNPIPWKRPGFRRNGHTYDQLASEKADYRRRIALECRDKPIEGPVILSVVFYIPRPKYHHTKVSGRLTKSAPKHHTVKPDIDNYSKFIMDCLNGIVYKDDAQVVSVQATKLYATDFIGTIITIE